MNVRSYIVAFGSLLSMSQIALAQRAQAPISILPAIVPFTIEQAIAIKESFEPRFFAVQDFNYVGITTCAMEVPYVVESVQEYCILAAVLSEEGYFSFVTNFPELEVGGLPIKLEIKGVFTPFPGVVVAD